MKLLFQVQVVGPLEEAPKLEAGEFDAILVRQGITIPEAMDAVYNDWISHVDWRIKLEDVRKVQAECARKSLDAAPTPTGHFYAAIRWSQRISQGEPLVD